jgi:hypothetical protein
MQQTGPNVAVSDNVAAMMQQTPSQAVSPQAQIAPQGRAAQVSAPPQGVGASMYGQPRVSVPTPNIDMLNRAIKMGAPASVVATLKKGADTEISQINEERKLNERKINKISFEKGGRTWTRTEDAMTREVLGEAPENALVKSVQDEKDFHLFKTANDDATKRLGLLSDASEVAQGKLASIGRIEEYYAKGAESGFAQASLTEIASAIGRATGRKDLKLADQQALNTELTKFALEVAESAKGAVSDYERKIFMQSVANSDNTPAANRKILATVRKMAERTVELQKTRLSMEDDGKSTPAEIYRAVEKKRISMPLFDESPAAPKANPADDILKEFGVKGK